MNNNNFYIYGINTILEALLKGYKFDRVLLKKGNINTKKEEIISLCKKNKIAFFFNDDSLFDQKVNHQGIIAYLKSSSRIYFSLEDGLSGISSKKNTMLALDRISDVHNFGAIIRSAYFFGIDCVLLEKKYSPPLNEVVHKVSSGASLLMPFIIINSLKNALLDLESKDHTVFTIDNLNNSLPIDQVDFSNYKNKIFVLGNEGSGVRRSITNVSKYILSIPALKNFDSLNVSVCAGIILYEVSKSSNIK